MTRKEELDQAWDEYKKAERDARAKRALAELQALEQCANEIEAAANKFIAIRDRKDANEESR